MIQSRADLLRLTNGFQASQAIHVAATLGLADHLHRRPASATELAHAMGVNAVALYRLMRALVAIGLIKQAEEDRFELTPVGTFLRGDIPETCAPMAELIGRPNFWAAWGDLLHTVRTGDTAFEHVHGCSVWDFRSRHPDEGRVFDRAMASGTEHFAQAVLDVCNFGSFKHVIDVGGGDGIFLNKILKSYPALHGTLFDQPHVIARAVKSQSFEAFDGRYRTVSGNFFESVPEGGDAYLLKWVLHDWDDTASIEILRSCGRAMRGGARLIVAEYVIDPQNPPVDGALMDLTMLVMAGGRERTQEEFESLFASAGFRLASVTPTATQLCVIEGVLDRE